VRHLPPPPAALRVTVVENGRRRTLNVCREDYAQLRAQQASPFESLFGAASSATTAC